MPVNDGKKEMTSKVASIYHVEANVNICSSCVRIWIASMSPNKSNREVCPTEGV